MEGIRKRKRISSYYKLLSRHFNATGQLATHEGVTNDLNSRQAHSEGSSQFCLPF
jgi:hypothetical protein